MARVVESALLANGFVLRARIAKIAWCADVVVLHVPLRAAFGNAFADRGCAHRIFVRMVNSVWCIVNLLVIVNDSKTGAHVWMFHDFNLYWKDFFEFR